MDLPTSVLRTVVADERRIVVAGARGWVGRTLLELLDRAQGPSLSDRVACFGSAAGQIVLSSGTTVVQQPLRDMANLPPRPSIVFHLAFLTMDKVAGMTDEAYVAANRAISNTVLAALPIIGADRLFLASSGAAAFADAAGAAAALRLYGRLKRDDEDRFAQWTQADPIRRRAAICRIYSLSGPYINKHETYALADFILKVQAGKPVAVNARTPVWRSYVAVREVLSLGLAMLLAEQGESVLRFDSGGEPMELGAVAAEVAAVLGGTVVPRAIEGGPPNRYCGDQDRWLALLDHHRLASMSLAQQVRETAAYLAGR
jgi:UDP-glucuronate decarboxylase